MIPKPVMHKKKTRGYRWFYWNGEKISAITRIKHSGMGTEPNGDPIYNSGIFT